MTAMASRTVSASALAQLQKSIAEFPIHRRWFPLNPSSPPSPPPSSSTSIPLTIVSYNLLAQALIRRSYLPYCSRATLRVNHRLNQLTAELLSLSPTIITLQEVDTDLYLSHYQPTLQHFGYRGQFASRPGGKHGLAIFYQEAVLREESYEALQFDDIANEYDDDQETQDELRKGNVAQIMALRSCAADGCGVLISNTHLHWNPHFRFVRLKQCERLLQAMHDTHSRLLPLQFHRLSCGDWNITPITSIFHYLTRGSIDPPLHYKFTRPPSREERRVDEAPPSIEASKPQDELRLDSEEQEAASTAAFNGRMEDVRSTIERRRQWPLLSSVYSRYTEVMADDIRESVMKSGKQDWSGWEGEGPHAPPFTHYVDHFKGTLDHLLVVEGGEQWEEGESRLEVVAVLEIPTEEVVTRHVALPNEELASDHLAIGMKCVLHS